MDMPFATVSDLTFLDLFTERVETGVWEIVNGEWTFGEWWYLSSVGWRFEPLDQDQDNEDQDDEDDQDEDDQDDQDEDDQDEAQLNDALHFGYETYGQDGPPAPLHGQAPVYNPLDYPPYDYEDPRDLD